MKTRGGSAVGSALIGALLWSGTAAASVEPVGEPAEPAESRQTVTVEAVDPGNSPDIIVRGDCGPDGQLAKVRDYDLHIIFPETNVLAAPGVTEATLDATVPYEIDSSHLPQRTEPSERTIDFGGFGTYGCSGGALSHAARTCVVIAIAGDVVSAVTETACMQYNDWIRGGAGAFLRGLYVSIRRPVDLTNTPFRSAVVQGACYADETAEAWVLDTIGNRVTPLGSVEHDAGPPVLRLVDVEFDLPIELFPESGTSTVLIEGRCFPDETSGYGPGTSDPRQWCHPVVLGPDAIVGYGDREVDCPSLSVPLGPTLRITEASDSGDSELPRSAPRTLSIDADCAEGAVVTGAVVTASGTAIDSTRFVARLDDHHRYVGAGASYEQAENDLDPEPDLVLRCADPEVPHAPAGPAQCFEIVHDQTEGYPTTYQYEAAVCSFSTAVPEPADEIPPTGTATRMMIVAALLLLVSGFALRRLAAVPIHPSQRIRP